MKGYLNIDFHLNILERFLEISKIKQQNNYEEIKQKINNSFFDANKNNKDLIKKKELIEHDLNRTSFLKDNPEHKESIRSILYSFFFGSNKNGNCQIKYYQGLNTVVSFFYQLLDCDEEKTFYYLYGLQFKTEYHLIFENNLKFLNILFLVFEKIINIDIPEISFILKSINIDINYFCSSWFITLFLDNITKIDRKNPPFLIIYFIEKFCINSWSAIFNLGLVILEVCYQKIQKLEKEELIKYIMNMIREENIFNNEKFEKCKRIYEKKEKLINTFFVNKLIDISKFEYNNKYLLNSD